MTNQLKYDKKQLKIAIIGSGIGGCSCSYFLSNIFHNQVEIDIFEKKNVIGGRTASFDYNGKEYECGESIINPNNLYMDQLRKICSLQKIEISKLDRGKFVAIINSIDAIYKTFKHKKWSFLDIYYFMKQFGFINVIKFLKWLIVSCRKIDKIYHLQDTGYTFITIDDLLHKTNSYLVNISQHNIKSVCHKMKFDKRIYNEIADAACLSNYSQGKTVNGFVGIIALANFMCTNLWLIKNGNKQLQERLLKLCGANVYLNSKVKYIGMKENEIDCKNLLKYENKGIEYEKIYDYIIISFPLSKKNYDDLKIDFDYNDHSQCDIKTTNVFFVRGQLNYNDLPKDKPVSIFSCDEMQSFHSIETVYSCDGKNEQPIYRILCSNEESINNLFKNFEILKHIEWDAYPDYKKIEDTIQEVKKEEKNLKSKQRRDKKSTTPLPQITKPSLYPRIIIDSTQRSRIFYLNSIEWLASSQEMKCINARNISLLISKKEQSEEITLKKNKIYADSKRDYYNDICGILSALSLFFLVFAIFFKEKNPKKLKF